VHSLAQENPRPDKGHSAPTTVIGDTLPERVGTVIGPYKLLQQIGEGGFGVVFMAEQEQPVRRTVALKIIKPGMDTAQVIARFESERQALALMDHPNIARVIDAGATDSGHPYFVMELVKGVPITEFCDKNHLVPEARLKLFLDVCHAIQHAHQKGIIHRDIKPSNVLVTMQDSGPVVKVIDFGVAKATVQKLTERTLFTAYGQMLGTPLYMSPEQAEMTGLDIDTRSDVYSLGVLLYELLTGTTPLEVERLRKADYTEMQRLIREKEPPRPSSRVLSLGDTATVLAGSRGLDAKHLVQVLVRDLDWVVMKALEKDRNRRYETANSLARDIERYLANEVVEARPPSAGYRVRKFVSRHRGQVLAASLVLLALVAGMVGTAWGLIRAARANADLIQSRAAVQERYELAVDAIKTFHTGVSEDFLLKEVKFKDLRDRFLKSASDFYEKLAALLKDAGDLPSRRALLQANFEVADLAYKVGRKEDALALFRRVLAGREALAASPGADPATAVDVARSFLAVGTVLEATGKPDEALDSYEKARMAVAASSGGPPEGAAARSAFADAEGKAGLLLKATGRTTEALRALERARDLDDALAGTEPANIERQSALANSCNNLGILLSQTGKPAAAEVEYRQALAIVQKLADADRKVAEWRSRLASSHNNLGYLLSETGKKAEAEAQYRQALDIQQKLADDNSAVTDFRSKLANSRTNFGQLLSETGRPAEAEAQYRQALAIQQKLADDNPAIPYFRDQLAVSHNNLGYLLSETGKPAEAEVEYRHALAIQQRLADDNPTATDFRKQLANSHNNLAQLLSDIGKPTEAKAEYRQALAIQQKLADDNPTVTYFRYQLANGHNNFGELLLDTGRLAEAEAQYRQALATGQKLAADNPKVDDFRYELASSHSGLGMVLSSTGKSAKAEAEFRATLAMRHKLAADNPTVTRYQSDLGTTYNELGRLLARNRRFDEAFAALNTGLSISQKVADADPKTTQYVNRLGCSYAYRGGTRVRAGQSAEAANDLRRALDVWSQHKVPEIETRFERARALALLAGLGADAKTGVTASGAAAFADQAALALRDAVNAGWARPDELKEPDFDSLRQREDFKKLVAELERVKTSE
jgi:serine/threonine-protein kinase